MRDVARHAGVSPMTVSRALSGANVRGDARERVAASVEALGYRRNENARSIRPGQRTGLVGAVITNISNPYYADVLLGLEEVAAAHGRRVVVGNSGEDAVRESQLLADFIGRQVEGVVVVPTGGTSAHLQPGALSGVPLVLASRATPDVDADTVLVDDVTGARAATALLLEQGHRRIAFLGHSLSAFTGRRRLQGYHEALARGGVEADEALVRMGQIDVASAERAMTELLDAPHRPTAVFSANNRNTIGALRAIVARGDRRATSLVGFDDFELADLSPIPLTVVDHDARELGRQAATMLLERILGGTEAAARRVELPTRLIEYPSAWYR